MYVYMMYIVDMEFIVHEIEFFSNIPVVPIFNEFSWSFVLHNSVYMYTHMQVFYKPMNSYSSYTDRQISKFS